MCLDLDNGNVEGGNYGDYLEEILEFDPDSEEWNLLSKEGLLQPRFGHAVSTIQWERVENYCQ